MMKFVWNGAELSCGEDSVRLDGRELALSRMERKLLLYLARHPDTVLSRERLLREVWEYELPGATRTVDTHVKNLRARLGGLGDFIVTVRGVGYRLDTGAGRADGHRSVPQQLPAGKRRPELHGEPPAYTILGNGERKRSTAMDLLAMLDALLICVLLVLAGLTVRLFRLSEPYGEWVARERRRRGKR